MHDIGAAVRADHGLQTVSRQVTKPINHITHHILLLLQLPVTSRPAGSDYFFCYLSPAANVCEQLAQGRYMKVEWLAVDQCKCNAVHHHASPSHAYNVLQLITKKDNCYEVKTQKN